MAEMIHYEMKRNKKVLDDIMVSEMMLLADREKMFDTNVGVGEDDGELELLELHKYEVLYA
tara:strand:- start:559 stop:741 length:183 start_codon:yes stop_codon:yes gene_type:complete